MPVTNVWYVKNHIIHTQLFGTVTANELIEAANLSVAMVQAGSPLVHSLIDMRAMTSFPTKLTEMAQLIPVLRAGSSGWLLIVADHPVARFLASTLSQIAGLRIRLFDDPVEALDFIVEVDSTIPPLPPFPPS
jgi:hypothetical protein